VTVRADVLQRGHRALWRASRAFTVATHRYRDLPDFLIVGAQRCGTTSMYTYLEHHPAVVPAVMTKGVHYFDVNHRKGDAWYSSHFPTRRYKAFASRRAGERVVTGESSPYYLFHPAVPARVAATIPDVRLIVMLRDPVSRAYSQYQHEKARGFETASFEDALEMEEERLAGEASRLSVDPYYYSFEHQHHSYVARGIYVEQLRRWLDVFPSSQILVVDSGNLFRETDRSYREVIAFLALRDHTLKRYPTMNAHRYPPMSDKARNFLERVFSQPNRELVDLVGRKFSWCESEVRGSTSAASGT
jgi:hypothetical protein